MSKFLWGVYPYLCLTLFFVVPIVRMAFRPFTWSTRASGLFGRTTLGWASTLFHWGLFAVLTGHLVGLFGGLVGAEGAVRTFYWLGLIGGLMVLTGSVVALVRRLSVAEVRAMSQLDDYLVHAFIITIVSLALYQVLVDRIFGVAFTASAWAASLWTFSPQPELLASATTITKLHIFIALTFLAYFPFTKLVHAWTYPINYFVRPYQSMRTQALRFRRRWELSLRSDKSWLVYGLGTAAALFVLASVLLGRASVAGISSPTVDGDGRLLGAPLYVSQCARCHGVSGRGDGLGASSPTFAARPRDLTKAVFHFVSTDNGVASDADLARTIRNGLVVAGMPAFDQLSDPQIASLVAVLRGLSTDARAPGANLLVPPRPPTTEMTVAAGQQVFATTCAVCHGAGGHGDGPAAAGLSPRPANLAGGRVKASRASEQLYLRVAAGVPPIMPAFRAQPAGGGLDARQIWEVVDYLEGRILPP